MKSNQVDPGLLAVIGRTLSEESADDLPHPKDIALDDVKHNLRMYYHHLNIAKSSEALGEKDHADAHMRKSSDRHGYAAALHKETQSKHGTDGPSFTDLKSEARDHVGYKD